MRITEAEYLKAKETCEKYLNQIRSEVGSITGETYLDDKFTFSPKLERTMKQYLYSNGIVKQYGSRIKKFQFDEIRRDLFSKSRNVGAKTLAEYDELFRTVNK